MRLAITDLPAAGQEAIARYYFAGQTLEQIGEAFGATARGVEGRLYRARAALRDKLRHFADG